MQDIKNYLDAIYHVKRGFLIIGLTGRTGSGCSTIRSLLENKEFLQLPGYNEISELLFPFDGAESRTKSQRNERIYKKLERVWNDLVIEPFVSIKVSTVIFAAALLRSMEKTFNDEMMDKIKVLAEKEKDTLQALQYLWKEEKPRKKNSEELIKGYKTADALYSQCRNDLSDKTAKFIRLMQDFGDEIRSFGKVKPDLPCVPDPKNLFVLPEALRRIIKAYRNANRTNHFVIDAFRNPFEIEFFKWRYSEFYLLAVLRDKNERWDSIDLLKNDKKDLDKRESKTKNREKDNIDKWIISQDLEECLTKADVYVENIKDKGSEFPYLRYNLIKLISLAKNPGCIPPSQDERCMQMAMTARQMSGCISRRVGAVVVDEDGYLSGFGWNDPPRGQPPCSLRTAHELVSNPHRQIFSAFEMSQDFKKHIRENCYPDHPFCFRSELVAFNKKDDDKKKSGNGKKEFTRALHAEENALLQATMKSGTNLKGSLLYTTDQPCTLCAKKSYHLGISHIVYIQDYPGIATDQTLEVGTRSVRIKRFQGITGSAYFKLYSNLMPEKDIIQLYQEN